MSQAELCLPLGSGKQIPLFYSLSIVQIMSGSLLSQTQAVLPLGLGQLALSERGVIEVSAWLSWDKGSTSAASIFSSSSLMGLARSNFGAGLAEKRDCAESHRNAKLSPVCSGACSRVTRARPCRAAAALAPAWSPGASSCP